MNTKPIYLSRPDYNRLKALVNALIASGNKGVALHNLHTEISRATVLDPASIPSLLVTLGSRVRIRDLDTDERETYTVVMPAEAQGGDRISVLAPIGVALLGYGEGDEVAWQTPGGLRRFWIEAVEQPAPEAKAPSPDILAQILGTRG
ncbi:MAG: GreA/GreB family elongation factor [Verrucomicrobiota bacterium JB022]|nr:GreA/GreB family elongation factor [Verrucomicrobiota bacterium JB022]